MNYNILNEKKICKSIVMLKRKNPTPIQKRKNGGGK